MFKGRIFACSRAFQHNSALSKKKKFKEQFLPKFKVVHFWNTIFTHEFYHLQKDGEMVLLCSILPNDSCGFVTLGKIDLFNDSRALISVVFKY